MVKSLTEARALRLRSVAVVNRWDNDDCAKRMELLTGSSANGPWSAVSTFTSTQTRERQVEFEREMGTGVTPAAFPSRALPS